MDPRTQKLMLKYHLTGEEAAALVADGLDGPAKIRQAAPERLPDKLRQRLPARPARADFTAIPRVGKEIQTALYNAGFQTFADLRAASDAELLAIPAIHGATLAKIREYLG